LPPSIFAPGKSPGQNYGTSGLAALWVLGDSLLEVQMKLLVSGSDTAKIELVRKKLLATQIPCEIRREIANDKHDALPCYPELWVLHDKDFLAASRVFIRHGVAKPSVGHRLKKRSR
jgi:hypothetical protein